VLLNIKTAFAGATKANEEKTAKRTFGKNELFAPVLRDDISFI
jgi:hypothetical protein